MSKFQRSLVRILLFSFLFSYPLISSVAVRADDFKNSSSKKRKEVTYERLEERSDSMLSYTNLHHYEGACGASSVADGMIGFCDVYEERKAPLFHRLRSFLLGLFHF